MDLAMTVDHTMFEPMARRVLKRGLTDLLPRLGGVDRDMYLHVAGEELAQQLAELCEQRVSELRGELLSAFLFRDEAA